MIIKPLDLASVIEQARLVRQQNPLVHCLTNEVVQNFTANALLALDISPAMVVAEQEVADFVPIADSLLINIGTLHEQRKQAMLLAVKSAKQHNKPWVLDPVAVGVVGYRSDFAKQLCALQPTVIRGNPAEILWLAGQHGKAKGVESQNNSNQALRHAIHLAQSYQTIVAVTGQTDYITDGQRTLSLDWGTPLLTKITGTGCALSAICAGFIAHTDDPLIAVASACAVSSLAGQLAEQEQSGLGSFQVHYLDALSRCPDNFS